MLYLGVSEYMPARHTIQGRDPVGIKKD
jgi:hypothetical protein